MSHKRRGKHDVMVKVTQMRITKSESVFRQERFVTIVESHYLATWERSILKLTYTYFGMTNTYYKWVFFIRSRHSE